MWLKNNVTYGWVWKILHAWGVLLAFVGPISGPVCADATRDGPDPPAAAGDGAQQVVVVDRSHALRVFHLAQDWVEAGVVAEPGSVPAIPGVPGVPVRGVVGARVTLRRLGVTLGQADTPANLSDANGAPVAEGSENLQTDLVDLVRRAVDRALKQVDDELKDSIPRAGPSRDKSKSPRQPRTLGEIGPLLALDIQIAHNLRPVRLPGVTSINQICQRFTPGFHGLYMTSQLPGVGGGPAQQAWIWPASALAGNVSPSSQVVQLLVALGAQPGNLPAFFRGHVITLNTFEVIHLTSGGGGQPVVNLTRGQLIAPPTSVSDETLHAMAERLTDHLRQRVRADGTVLGTYLPTSDRYDPIEAAPREATLTAYALSRRARFYTGTRPRQAGELLRLSEAVARRLLDETVPRMGRGDEMNKASVQAYLLLAIVSGSYGPDWKTHRDTLAASLAEAVLARSLLASTPPTEQPTTATTSAPQQPSTTAATERDPWPASVRALALAALTQVNAQAPSQDTKNAIEVLAGSLRLVDPITDDELVRALPWFLETLDHLPRSTPEPSQPPQPPEASVNSPRQGFTRADLARALSRWADSLRAVQVRVTPPGQPGDAVGGFNIDPLTAVAGPDWRSGYGLWFLAAAVRRPEVRGDAELAQWILDCGLAGRYVRQLMFDEANSYYVRSPSDALDGVRVSAWDNRLPVEATAVSLLAVTELEETLQWLTSQPGESFTGKSP